MQGYAQDMNDNRASHGRATSRDSSRSFQQQQGGSGRPPVISAGAALYSHAMASVKQPGWGTSGSSPSSAMPPPISQTAQSSRLPTAAEEKEMLRRYNDATNAVHRHHEANFGPSDGVMSSASSSMPHGTSVGSDMDMDNSYASAPDELPPPWVPSAEFSPQVESMSEKERYRIAYEARERAAAQQQPPLASPPPSASPPVSPPADYYTATGMRPSTSGSVTSPPADYYTATGMRPSTSGSMTTDRGQPPPPWQPQPPAQPGGLPLPPNLRTRSPPLPPASSQRIMSAAEEKAMLKAKYESEEPKAASPPPSTPPKAKGAAHNNNNNSPSPTTQTQTPPQTPPPPPLMPRPPASYIQETAEEDARLQDELLATDGNGNADVAGAAAHTTTTIVHRSATVGARLGTSTNSSPRRISSGSGTLSFGDDNTTHSGLLRSHTMGWDSIAVRAGSGANGFAAPSSPAGAPPPLPPKVPLEH